jgi:hypothetical protein
MSVNAPDALSYNHGFRNHSTGFPAANSRSLISAIIVANFGADALVPPSMKQLSSQEERRQFRTLIGYRPTKKNPAKYYYDSTNIPILHKDYAGKYNPTKFFLHESL